MNWFRFHHEALDDPKVQRLPPALFKQWVNLLCVASLTEPRGTLPELDALAFRLRMNEGQTSTLIERLTTAGLIDRDASGRMVPHNWNGRQRQSDDIAERVRRHRAKDSGNEPVTLHETPKKQSRATETETDTETERPPSPPSGKATYADVLNGALPSLLSMFRSIDKQYTDDWVKLVLVEAESQVGPLPRDKLGKGLDLAVDQIKRAAAAGKVTSPRPFARKLIVDYLMEQKHGRSAA